MKKLNNITWHTITGIKGAGSVTRGHFHDDPMTTLCIIREVDSEAGDNTTLFLLTGIGVEPSHGHPGIHLITLDEAKEHAEAALYTWIAVHARQVLNTVVDFLEANRLDLYRQDAVRPAYWVVSNRHGTELATGPTAREAIQEACNILGWKGKYGDDESPVVRFHEDVEKKLEGVAKL